MNMNLMDMLKAIKNPKQFCINMIQKNINNPMIDNLINMANNGNQKGLENFAKNICSQQGVDFEKEFANFMSTIKQL